MPKFMLASTVLSRLIEDEEASIGARCAALKQLDRPALTLLRRLLVDTDKRTTPVPARLKAIAALKYARELQLRNLKPRKRKETAASANPLGI